MRRGSCVDCGQGTESRGAVGPLPRRCEQCKRQYIAKKNAAARAKIKKRSPVVTCTDCGIELEWSGKGRPKDRCDSCRIEHNRVGAKERWAAWAEADPERAREHWRQQYRKHAERIRASKLDQHYRYNYGITRTERDQMEVDQGGVCAICGGLPHPNHNGSRLQVDHCHDTGAVRNLLCGNCNTMIGLAGHDPARLLAAAKYLEKWSR